MEIWDDQISKPKKAVSDILKKNILLVVLCWGNLFISEDRFQITWIEIGLSIISILYPAYYLFMIKNVKRAYHMHLVWFTLLIPGTLLVLDVSVYRSSPSPSQGVLYFFALLLLIIFLSTVFIRYVRQNMRDAVRENIESGRLNIDGELWDLNKPLHLDIPEKESKQYDILSRISKFSPVVVAIVFLLLEVLMVLMS